MKISTNVKKLVLAAAVSAVATGVMAATNPGSPAADKSTGDFDVTFSQGAQLRIWGLRDMSFTEALTQDRSQSVDFCTYSNNTDEVVFEAQSDTGDFTLAGPGDALNYTLKVEDSANASNADEWGDGLLASNDQGYYRYPASQKNTPGDFCGGTQQLNTVTVTIPAQTVTADGAYTDTVTLTIKPI